MSCLRWCRQDSSAGGAAVAVPGDAVTQAAMVAASAVAATQPFLRMQQELEQRLADLMEKLADKQQQQPPHSTWVQSINITEQNRYR